MYQDLIRNSNYKNIEQLVANFELGLAKRLIYMDGTIGKRSYPNPTSQPPTFVYWTALGTWGFLRRRPDGTWPTKSQLHRTIESHKVSSRLMDDDGYYLDDIQELFIRPPKWHDRNGMLSFNMPQKEREFVQRQLVGVLKPGDSNTPALLSNLAKNVEKLNIERDPELWSKEILQFADTEDKQALQRSQRAAALSAVGRAVYAAMVETIREKEDGLSTDRLHRDYLPVVRGDFTKIACRLDLDALHTDIPDLPPYLLAVLDATLNWLKKPKDPLALRHVYAKAEKMRKGRRARLPMSLSAKERRAEWQPEDQAPAKPIHYRWPNVIRLLKDLKGVA